MLVECMLSSFTSAYIGCTKVSPTHEQLTRLRNRVSLLLSLPLPLAFPSCLPDRMPRSSLLLRYPPRREALQRFELLRHVPYWSRLQYCPYRPVYNTRPFFDCQGALGTAMVSVGVSIQLSEDRCLPSMLNAKCGVLKRRRPTLGERSRLR